MDNNYGVKYNLNVNGRDASQELTNFLGTAEAVIPKINNLFKEVNQNIKLTLGNMDKLKRGMRGIGGNSRFSTGGGRGLPTGRAGMVVRPPSSGGATRRNGSSFMNRSASMRGGVLANSFSPTSMMSAGGIPFATTLGAGMIGLGISKMMKEAAEFQHTMVSVRAILRTSDEDAITFDKRFQAMSKTMRQLGVDTKFTAVEIGGATKFLAMAGMSVATIDKSMKSIINLATIGDTALPEMADVVTNIMTGYGVGAKEITKVSDNMASVVSNSNVNVMEMGESMAYASNYMRIAGIDFSEGAAAIGVLGNAGIKGSRAGTAIRAMIIRMIKPTAAAKTVIDKLGMSFTHMVTKGGKTKEMLKPLADIFAEFKAKGASASDLTTIFDKIGGGSALALFNNIKEFRSLSSTAGMSGGVSDFLAEEKMKTVTGLTQQLNSKFLDLGQTLFNRLSPKISQMMQELLGWLKTDEAASVFDSIEDGLSSLLDGLKKVTVFIKGNWNWLKFVLGGVAIKGLLGKGMGLGAGLLGNVRGITGAIGGLGRLATGGLTARLGSSVSLGAINMLGGLGAAGDAAALGIGSAVASLTALVAGGAIVAGVAAIGYQFYKIHKSAVMISDIREDMADWSMSTTGLNTDALDTLQTKLDNIFEVSNKITKGKSDIFQVEKGKEAVAAFDEAAKLTTNAFAFFTPGTKKKANEDVAKTVRELALGGSNGQVIKELGLDYFRKDKTESLTKLSALQRQFQSVSKTKNINDAIIRSGAGVGVKWSTGNKQKMLTESWEYNDELNKLTLAKMQQLRVATTAIKSGTKVGGIQAIDALLSTGSGIDLKDTWSQVKNRNLVKSENIAARLPKGVSVQTIINDLKTTGYTADFINKLMTQSGLIGAINSKVSTDGSGGNITGLGQEEELYSTKGLSGTGGISSRGNKMIIVNIDKLWNVEEANFNKEEDLEVTKDRIAQALTDVIKDFEISNFEN